MYSRTKKQSLACCAEIIFKYSHEISKEHSNNVTITTNNSNHNQDLYQSVIRHTHTHTQSTEIIEEAGEDRESASTVAVVGFK